MRGRMFIGSRVYMMTHGARLLVSFSTGLPSRAFWIAFMTYMGGRIHRSDPGSFDMLRSTRERECEKGKKIHLILVRKAMELEFGEDQLPVDFYLKAACSIQSK